MPTRLLREGIIDSEAVNSLTWPAEVFYRRLMSLVDDFGLFDGRPNILRSRLYPAKVESVREADISRWIAECEKAGLIALYSVNSKPYILFGNLGEPRAKDPKYPRPPADVYNRLQPFTDANRCAQMKTDENNGLQPFASVPYSVSSSDTNANSGASKPPDPPKQKSQGADDVPIPEPLAGIPAFVEVWAEWKAARSTAGKPLTALAAKKQLAQLEKLTPENAVACVNASIANQWQGIFPEKFTARRPAGGQQYQTAREKNDDFLAQQFADAGVFDPTGEVR